MALNAPTVIILRNTHLALQEQISVAVFKNSPRLWGFPLRNYRSACD